MVRGKETVIGFVWCVVCGLVCGVCDVVVWWCVWCVSMACDL